VTRSLAIVHWMPVEMYPPTMNIARFFADSGWAVTIHTTRAAHPLPVFSHPNVVVKRGAKTSGKPAVVRAAATGAFHAATATRLVSSRPDAILYFEPQSSFPVLLSRVLRDVPLFIHHHEYHEPHEFEERGMRLARMFHRREQKRLFPRAKWISHTNADRLELFLRDNPGVDRRIAKVLPNLPPASWSTTPNQAWTASPPPPLRMVYVGSLSVADTWIAELLRWISSQPEELVSLDVYSYNIDAEARQLLAGHSRVNWFPSGVPYDELPERLRQYHTGVILYKANTVNYRHNASNKLFEYLACGLEVLYSSRMLGVKPYARLDASPRVMEADFENPQSIDIAMLAHRDGLPAAPAPESAESAIAALERAVSTAVAEKQAAR
jgi:hypothetical protein